MLSRYNDKRLRITTEDGSVFPGPAQALPSGYGLHEFGRAEESLHIGDVILFKSDIKTIEVLPDSGSGGIRPKQFDVLMGDLLEGPYWIADILPEQNAMIDIEHDDTYMTVYDPDSRLLDKLQKLAASEGLFLWSPPEYHSL